MSKTATKNWENRIVSHGEKPAKDFKFNPNNWRKHPEAQRIVLNDILSDIGWVTGVIENKTTGNLIDGQARIEEALESNPEPLVPFVEVELSEDEEQKMLLLFDPSTTLSEIDHDKLLDLANLVESDLDIVSSLRSIAEIGTVPLDEFFDNAELPQDDNSIEPNKDSIILNYPSKTLKRVKQELLKHGETYEEAVLNLLGLKST